ncbi:uncharacterized protein LOC144912756 isoform X2 [Branchiostoma floridae x Branchiostoma belcheri]
MPPILCPWERHFTRLSSLRSGCVHEGSAIAEDTFFVDSTGAGCYCQHQSVTCECEYGGNHYRPGSVIISSTSSCGCTAGIICSEDGSVIYGDSAECFDPSICG